MADKERIDRAPVLGRAEDMEAAVLIEVGHPSRPDREELMHEHIVRIRERAAAEAVAEYERAITWGTTCLSCSKVLDSCYAETERAEKAEAELERLREGVKALAEEWRYKGEHGWGAWQEGHGPDQEGYALDHAASKLRGLLDEDGGA